MKVCRRHVSWTAGVMLGVALAAAPASAQEPLTRAKTYYASAAYEDALLALSAVGPTAPVPEATEAAAYRVFCLLALGRADEAKAAVAALVGIDASYRPTEAEASPRVLAFFDETRRVALADVARDRFASARQAFDRGDLAEAAAGFGRVIELVGQSEQAGADLADLGILAAGFKDLADQTVARAEAEAAAAAPVEAEPGAAPDPEADRVYTDEDAGVSAPKVRRRMLPQWSPTSLADRGMEFSGVIEVIIDREGRIESSRMRDSVHPLYDSLLLQAASAWMFEPATKDGAPVRYRYRLGVRGGK